MGDEDTMCCVYVADFSMRAEVRRVIAALQRLAFEMRCGFKPDFFTELNIMAGNQWRLEPTLYR